MQDTAEPTNNVRHLVNTFIQNSMSMGDPSGNWKSNWLATAGVKVFLFNMSRDLCNCAQ